MKKIQKIICMLLLAAMLFTLLPMETFAMSVTSPAQNVNSTKYFTALPGVYEMGDGYAVIWATSFSGTGYIKYTYGGVQYTVYDQRNNIVRTNDTVHVVKVPYAHLQGNRYTVYSTEVTGHNYAVTNYGTTISAGPIELKAYDGGVNDFDLLVLTDTHKELTWSKEVAGRFGGDPDMVIFSGDIVDSIETKADIELLFNIMGSVTGGRYPIVYCRGNHETRGIYAANLLEYFPTKTGEFYYDFRYGPLWGVVMDTGEDKVDTHEYYGNLSNYKEYNQKQEAWLRSLRMDTTATYRLAVNHIPQLASSDSGRGSMANGIDFTDSIGHLGIQFAVSGHDHRCRLLGQNEVGVAHATFIAGGYAVKAATWVTLNNTTKKAYITAKKNDGTIYSGNYGSFNNYAVNLSSYVGPVPSALSEPDWGLNAQFNPTAASKGTISIAVPPTVFETGGDWYNIVWTTHSTSSTAKGSTGYVEYTYNGKTYQQFDEVGGYRRAFDTIHTVKVPKEHLNNNTYKVGSFLVEYSYTNPSAQSGRYYTAGDYVESGEYVFEFKADQKAVNLLAFPDIKTNNGDTSGAASAAWNSMNSLGTSPTYVVVNGDVLDVALYSAGDMAAFLCGTANVSGGHYPVIYSRGNSECRGAFATELIEYLPTATGEFYYTLPVGDYTFVNLDTAEDDPDNAIISYNGNPNFVKYGGRVFLDSLRKQQLSWINSLSSGKIVAISHIPFNTVKSRFGLDYESALKAKGAVLAIGGHDNTNSLKETVNASNIYTVVPGGFKSSAYTGSSILLSGDYAYINTCQYNYSGKTASTLTQKAVSLTSGQTCSYSSSKPPLANGVYTVSTPGHLKWLAANATSTKSFSGYTFKLANDIDMMLVPFTPIGGNDTQSTDSNSASKGFAGTFDGNGYTIRNLNIVTDNNNVGFFGVVRSGTVKNLTLSGGMVDGGWYVGGLAGLSTGGTFQNCYSDLMIYSKSGSKIGGLTGFLSGGSTVDRCANYGSVSARLSNGSTGGITGQVHGSTTNRILNTYNRGTVLAHGSSALAGGIFGYAGNVSGTIQNCYNAASVTSPGSKGTIAGSFSGSSNVAILNTYFVKGYNGATTAAKNSNSWSTSAGSGTVTGKSKTAMKSQAAAEALNADVFVYNAKENDGYPVHKNSLHSSGLPDHSYVAVVTAPTCTEEGYTTYTCECGDSYVGDKVAAKGHSYKTVTVDATCTKNGSITKTCTACGHAVTTTIPSTGHSYKAVVTAPTCDKEGYTTYTCACGNSYVADKVAAKGHSYKSVTVDPTCTQDGSITKTCTACGHAVTTTIPSVGHSYKAVATAPTCDKEGYTTYTCACGDSYVADKVAAKGHSYKTVTVDPTCTQDGSITKTCTACGHAVTTTIPSVGHSYKAVVTAPTCDKEGYTTYTCACGDSYVADQVAAKGHSYKAVVTAPTCDKEGYTTYTCACGNSYIADKVAAKGHSYKSVTVDPTCTEDGSITKTCTACGHAVTTTIPSVGHNYKAVVTAPTCDKEGYTTYTCACGDSYVADKVAAKGHSYTSVTVDPTCTQDGTITKTCGTCGDVITETIPSKGHSYKTATVDATCTEDGSVTKTCNTCGDVVTETIPSTGHSHSAVVTPPTCTEDGYTTYTCACGDSYVADKVAAKGHSYKTVTVDATCTQDGSITETCSGCGDTTTTTIPSQGHSYADGSCEICGNPDPDYIAPAVPFILVGDMNDWNENVHIMTGDTVVSVTMTLNAGNYRFKIRHGEEAYGNDGVIVDSTASTSENGWLMRTSAGNCTLSASGGKYKFTFDTETDMLVITRQTNETEDAPISNGTITLKTVSLSLEDEILYNVYFTVADMTVDVEDLGLLVWDSEPAVPTINGDGTVIEGATYDPVKARYGIRTMGIPARDMGDLKYMVVYAKQSDGSYVYSKVLQYSVKTYCLNRVQKTDDPNLRALCVAIMNYGAEAQKYFAATSDYTYTQLMNVGFEEYQDLVVGYDPGLLLQPGAVDAAKAGVFGTEKNGFSKRSVSMSAEGIFSLNYYFTPAVNVDKVTFCYWTEEQYNSVTTLTPANVSGTKEMVASDGGKVYWASVDGIAAKDLDQTIYACGVYEIDGVLYSTGVIPYSLAKYCTNKASTENDVQDLAAATVVYSYHAKAYFDAIKALSADT